MQPQGRGPSGGVLARQAFEEEALALLDRLYGTALRLAGNRADAEDLVQDTYLKAFRFAERFEPGTNLKAWLFTILHNTHLNARRQVRRNPIEVDSAAVEQSAAAAPGRDDPEALVMRDVLDVDLKAALDALPEAFREAVWLRDVEEFSYAEIASMLEVPIGTVMSRISRGRRLLHDGLVERRAAGRTVNL
ncbi:MAG: sigma-70 family RNA polymerase sigma factor [Acidobacteria bacterium]|nr:sigma-70 family RNA polymerase sigma factor [Acidobacteriota bacterium]